MPLDVSLHQLVVFVCICILCVLLCVSMAVMCLYIHSDSIYLTKVFKDFHIPLNENVVNYEI